MFFKLNSLNPNGNLFYYISYIGNIKTGQNIGLKSSTKQEKNVLELSELKTCDSFGVPVLLQA
jgi:hypothetical protein